MLRPQSHKTHDITKIQTYNSLKDELEHQNAILMKQRYNITQQLQSPSGNLPYNSVYTEYNKTNYENSLNQSPTKKFQQENIVNLLKIKVQQVIQLCQGCEENVKEYGQIDEVVEAEKQILNFLNRISQQDMPINGKNISNSQKKKGSNKKKNKVNKTENNQTHPMEGFRKFIGDEAMQMIEEIERKALLQIQNLRTDKINLMKRLNQEIRAHNEEKRLRMVNENGNQQNRNFSQTSKRLPKPQRLPPQHMEVVEQQQNQENYDGYNDGTSVQVNTPLPREQIRPQSQQRPRSQVPSLTPYPQIQPHSPQNGRYKISQPLIANHHGSKQFKAGQQILQEMETLKNQNQRIKSALAGGQDLSGNLQLKSHLKNQLGQLEAKIHHYQEILGQSKRLQQQSGGFDLREFQNLFAQANQITEEGNRLLRNKKSTQHRTTMGSYGYDQPNLQVNKSFGKNKSRAEIRQEQHYETSGRGTFDYIRPPLQTFSPMDKSYHSQTYKNGFSPNQYENIIEKMRNATRI